MRKKTKETAETDYGEIKSDDVLFATSPRRSKFLNWVLDSGCEHHIFFQKTTLSIVYR